MSKFFSYQRLNRPSRIFFWIIVVLGASALDAAIKGPPAPPPTPPTPEQVRQAKQDDDLGSAKYYCREQISKLANDPDSVIYTNKYPNSDYGGVVQNKKTKAVIFEVQTELRARNAFGAYIRKVVECDYLYTPEGKTIPMRVQGL